MMLGISSVYYNNIEAIEKYEGMPVFENLKDTINDINKIKIKTHDKEIVFIKQDNVWIIEGQNLPVYQERIRSFLSALLEARFYEKKSDKVENLSIFGLQPIESENSPNTRIELLDANNNSIQSFETGKYDIDLGRGSKAAYIKFDGQFQVWLIEVDFIDLSSDYKDWTYSNIWNLRFGRLVSVDNNTNAQNLANLMKVILNNPLGQSKKNLEDAKKVYTMNLKIENYNEVVLDFYQQDNHIWLRYEFSEPINTHHLQFFEKYVNGLFFEISKESLELIKYATESNKRANQ